MPHDQEDGSFSADIPADAIAEALAAVERRAARAEPPPGGSDVPIEVQAETAGATPTEQGPPTGEVERLRLELEMSQERSRKVFEQLKDEHDRLLRTTADLDNYKKRAMREKD
ncbi:MAG TPA: nucleotide exchange factor GrpE, partial [Anaeromyxobacteraceae bacterium]